MDSFHNTHTHVHTHTQTHACTHMHKHTTCIKTKLLRMYKHKLLKTRPTPELHRLSINNLWQHFIWTKVHHILHNWSWSIFPLQTTDRQFPHSSPSARYKCSSALTLRLLWLHRTDRAKTSPLLVKSTFYFFTEQALPISRKSYQAAIVGRVFE